MKKSKGKNVLILSLLALLVFCFVMPLCTSIANLYASADIITNEEQSIADNSGQQIEELLAQTREEYSELNEFPYSEEIESEMKKQV